MTQASKTAQVRNAVVLAVLYEALMMVLGWLLTGPPKSMSSMTSLKLTVTVGMPSLTQLLEPAHQFTSLNLQSFGLIAVLFTVLSMVLFSFANALYIAQLGRSRRVVNGSAWDDAKRSTLPLLGFMLLQLLLGIGMLLFLQILGMFGGIVSVILLLWFRYAFFFFEYTVVLRRVSFAEAWTLCREIRKKAEGLGILFLFILLVNAFLAFVVNMLFSWPVLLVMLAVNAVIGTLLQRRALDLFFAAEPA
ncbi:MAG: hypothetical protein WCC10_07465 [Tumebacillaceae bacterium]